MIKQGKIEDVLETLGTIIQVVVGDSMMPTLIQYTDLVIIDAVSANSTFIKGDIVLYKRPTTQHYILHRITKVKELSVITCGDNRIHQENVPKTWILGRLVEIQRDSKRYQINELSLTWRESLIVNNRWVRIILTYIRRLQKHIKCEIQ